mgnify:CR=1 FL=1
MFFNVIKGNSRKIRKENRVYFSSLIISIIAFYAILSLGEQDVMVYLKTVESDAVAKLLLLIPMLYVVSLFFVFFLVYFANKYQLELRHREIGLYFMMGMKRSKLFAMLMGETLWNGFLALMIGIPVSLFLTEMISLTTSRLVGMGIIGHQFRISWNGLSLTIIGFMFVQFVAMIILSLKISPKEPAELLNDQKEEKQKFLSPMWGIVHLLTGAVFLLGAIFLCIAYGLAILYLRTLNDKLFALILIVGIVGTFMLFRGLGSLIGAWIKQKGKTSTGLFVFTGRQLQENVLNQWGSLAISSLLMLMAMLSFTYGISTALNISNTSNRTVDFTFQGSEEEIVPILTSEKLKPYVKEYYPMKLGSLGHSNMFSWSGLIAAVSKEESSEQKEILINNLTQQDRPYLISLSSYNRMLQLNNESPITLEGREVALYTDAEWFYSHELLEKALQSKPVISIGEKQFQFTSNLYTSNIVADRAITLSYALIVPDEIYDEFTGSKDPYFWNMTLDVEFVKEKGLMQAIHEVDGVLSTTNLEYESYLSSMGRQLFYTVAGSYTTLYLGVMFLIIANSVLGLKFLIQQKSTRHRYFVVAMLGASVESLRWSARKQIWLYFSLVISVALISSIFGIWSMLNTFPNSININQDISTILIPVIIFIVFELGYIWMIQRKSDEEIKKLEEVR